MLCPPLLRCLDSLWISGLLCSIVLLLNSTPIGRVFTLTQDFNSGRLNENKIDLNRFFLKTMTTKTTMKQQWKRWQWKQQWNNNENNENKIDLNKFSSSILFLVDGQKSVICDNLWTQSVNIQGLSSERPESGGKTARDSGSCQVSPTSWWDGWNGIYCGYFLIAIKMRCSKGQLSLKI